MNYKSALTLRYGIALALIACVLTGSYFILVRQIDANQQDAHIINISGMQRMLSQRIALLAREIEHTRDPVKAEEYIEKLRPLIMRMRENHAELYQPGSTTMPTEEKAHYAGKDGIHARLEVYLPLAEKLVADYDAGGLDVVQASGYPQQLAVIARNGLLKQLDDAVFYYQTQAEQKVAEFRQLESMMFVAGLMVLLLEVLFIFRPMVRHIVEKTESLERANAELTEFSYRISHDLRAPIVSSIGLADVNMKALETGNIPQAQQGLVHMKNSLIKLEALVEDVLNLTRMKFSVATPEAVDIANLYEDAISKFSNLPAVQSIDMESDITLDEPLYVKRLYVQQIVENLLSNAIKYHDRAKQQPRIKFTASQSGGRCIISVKDNGVGVPEIARDKLFGMFQRMHSDISFGSGLGLYLVQQNARALGGDAMYEPLDDGSEFRVTFPVQKAA